ncbi:MAG: hypothetical protein WA634_10635 [Silvibacterium sp.]
MNSVRTVTFLTLSMALFAVCASAQAQATDSGTVESKADARTYKTLYLAGSTQMNDALDIQTDLRNFLPRAKLYYVRSQNAISMFGTPDDFMLAQKILSDLDRARKTYRLTYTITDTENGQRVGTQRVALIVISGGMTELKQGSRVPIVTGTSDAGRSTQSDQVQYLDVGLNIKASLEGPPDHLSLRTKVEQSSVAEEKSGYGAQDPVVRQTTLDGTSTLVQGKPVVLGSFDLSGSGRRVEIEVSSEPIS